MYKQLLFLVALTMSYNILLAQTPVGGVPGAKAQKYLDATSEARSEYVQNNRWQYEGTIKSGNSGITYVPVQAHILQDPNGFGAMTFFEYSYILRDLNEILAPANIQLYNCSKINYIRSSALADFNHTLEELQLANYDVSGAVNFYFFNEIVYGGVPVCGWSTYPGDGNRVALSKRCFGYDRITVLTYLFGQYFSLYPTHRFNAGGNNSQMTDELVARTNCTTAGDELCDTPADPRLNRSGAMSGCTYVGVFRDQQNALFTPLTNNYMSLAGGSCRDSFTPGQLARMNYSIQNDRPSLNCSKQAYCANQVISYPSVYTFENGWQGWENIPFYQSVIYGDFLLNTGATPTANTGPSSAYEGQQYVYAEADISPLDMNESIYGYPNAIIESPCFDFSALQAPQIAFSYHMSGAHINALTVQATLDGGFVWDSLLTTINGDQGNMWQRDTIDLSNFAGKSGVRFRFVAGFAGQLGLNEGDIALDAIKVEDASPCVFNVEGTPTAVSCFGGSDGSIALSFPNPGTPPYTIDWSTGVQNVSSISGLSRGTYNATITDAQNCWDVVEVFVDEADELTASFVTTDATAGQADGSIATTVNGGTSPYTFAWSNNTISQNPQGLAAATYAVTITDNNGCTLTESVVVNEAISCSSTRSNFPYNQGLEGGLGWFRQEQVPVDDRNWRKRSGGTNTNNTGPSSAAEGTYYRYMESSGSNNHPNKTAILFTRHCLDLAGVVSPVFRFQYHMYGNTMGSLEIQISEDAGTTWSTSVWSRSGNQGNSWQTATIDLSTYAIGTLKIRIVGTTGTGPRSDIAIDDLYIGAASGALNNEIPMIAGRSEQSVELENTFELFPNPAQDQVQLRMSSGNYELLLINSIGQVIQQQIIMPEQTQLQLDVSRLPKGLYYVFLKNMETASVDRKTLIVTGE
ncbi:MAG: T9SS type A sorting domain-containing protein [Bacteroidota bacterium]